MKNYILLVLIALVNTACLSPTQKLKKDNINIIGTWVANPDLTIEYLTKVYKQNIKNIKTDSAKAKQHLALTIEKDRFESTVKEIQQPHVQKIIKNTGFIFKKDKQMTDLSGKKSGKWEITTDRKLLLQSEELNIIHLSKKKLVLQENEKIIGFIKQ